MINHLVDVFREKESKLDSVFVEFDSAVNALPFEDKDKVLREVGITSDLLKEIENLRSEKEKIETKYNQLEAKYYKTGDELDRSSLAFVGGAITSKYIEISQKLGADNLYLTDSIINSRNYLEGSSTGMSALASLFPKNVDGSVSFSSGIGSAISPFLTKDSEGNLVYNSSPLGSSSALASLFPKNVDGSVSFSSRISSAISPFLTKDSEGNLVYNPSPLGSVSALASLFPKNADGSVSLTSVSSGIGGAINTFDINSGELGGLIYDSLGVPVKPKNAKTGGKKIKSKSLKPSKNTGDKKNKRQ